MTSEAIINTNITFIAFLTEGAMMDWGGLFLMEEHNVDMSLAATGFMVFSAAMLLIRLTGDTIVTKLGDKAVAVGGSILALMGFLLLIFGFNAIHRRTDIMGNAV